VEEAQYVIVIATATGWTEHHIRHELPLSRGYAYYHTARLLAGEKCRWPHQASRNERWVDGLKKWIRRHLAPGNTN
jgi:hypothetical protein